MSHIATLFNLPRLWDFCYQPTFTLPPLTRMTILTTKLLEENTYVAASVALETDITVSGDCYTWVSGSFFPSVQCVLKFICCDSSNTGNGKIPQESAGHPETSLLCSARFRLSFQATVFQKGLGAGRLPSPLQAGSVLLHRH